MAKSRDEVACIRNACAVTGTGMEAARAALKPGVRECEVQAEAFRTMFGLGSEWFMSSGAVCSGPGSVPFVLKPGMVFSVEPYAGEEGIGGIRLEDNVIVTETGYELISTFPFEEKLMG